MGWGANAILEIARATAALPQATLRVPHAPPWGLAVMALGIAWLGLWRSPIRLAGIVPIVVALLSPAFVQLPDILVSDDAKLIALRTPSGAYLQHVSGGSKFTREAWEQYWAEAAFTPFPASGAAADGLIDCTARDCLLRSRPDAPPALLLRPGAVGPARCDDAVVLLASEPAKGVCPRGGARLVDRFTVWRQGAEAIWLTRGGAQLLSDREWRGNRPWVPPLVYPKRKEVPEPLPHEPINE